VYQKNATMDMLDIIDVIIMEIVPIQVSITKKQMDTMIVNAINSMMDQRAQINNNTMKQQRLQQYNQQQEKH
jgi:acetyl-CoA carboxylase alpha subunit